MSCCTGLSLFRSGNSMYETDAKFELKKQSVRAACKRNEMMYGTPKLASLDNHVQLVAALNWNTNQISEFQLCQISDVNGVQHAVYRCRLKSILSKGLGCLTFAIVSIRSQDVISYRLLICVPRRWRWLCIIVAQSSFKKLDILHLHPSRFFE